MKMSNNQAKDVVLISGLINIHRWGKAFIQTLVNEWGSGNVYIVYTNEGTNVTKQQIDGKTIYSIGPNNYRSGSQSVQTQALVFEKKIRMLQAEYGLGKHFHIIAHSMGGLVSRQYIYNNPNIVAGLVTLGTPNHGSPLANFYKWLSYLIGARRAYANLTPKWVASFNLQCPIDQAPLWNNGKIYTIRGYTSNNPFKNFGVIGEVLFAWLTLRFIYRTKSDGLVPEESVLAEGAVHVADYPGLHHLDLVRSPIVAEKASSVLRKSSSTKATL